MVIHHWEMVVEMEDARPEGFNRAVQKFATLFYAKNEILASPQRSKIQETLDVPTGLFYRDGIRENSNKTVVMVCQPCCTSDRKFEVVYTRRMKGGGISYSTTQWDKVR